MTEQSTHTYKYIWAKRRRRRGRKKRPFGPFIGPTQSRATIVSSEPLWIREHIDTEVEEENIKTRSISVLHLAHLGKNRFRLLFSSGQKNIKYLPRTCRFSLAQSVYSIHCLHQVDGFFFRCKLFFFFFKNFMIRPVQLTWSLHLRKQKNWVKLMTMGAKKFWRSLIHSWAALRVFYVCFPVQMWLTWLLHFAVCLEHVQVLFFFNWTFFF